MISKETKENLMNDTLKVDITNVRDVAELYKELHELGKLVEEKMNKLQPILVDNKVHEVFTEEEKKVQWQQGSEITKLNNKIVFENMDVDSFLEVCSVSESALKKSLNINGEALIAKAKIKTGKFKSDSIRVTKMTKKELEEEWQNSLK